MKNEEKRTIAMRTELEIEDQLVSVIIDTGAAISVITDKLKRKLNIPIFGKKEQGETITIPMRYEKEVIYESEESEDDKKYESNDEKEVYGIYQNFNFQSM
ncbi:hypothetical protein RhiirA4_426892 [Rhizophagus irregularis]|uniref:Peptidase A2 domain-containing protein n=1 Tax=Rhizophagus irregularis TaxID=588596 RepID=A0A2I1H6V0_9GLOM|nr:hypothetical protein RhiirA4_421688 [Rhizophagus irregularis]PKY54608.1 hypothetical protein RhiirA4_426892 [Rhizophagus irregularis]